MADAEFDDHAAAIAARLLEADRRRGLAPYERFAAACRGSANPAALAWIAESLQLHERSTVVDLGSGIGGPAAWIAARYGCRVIGLEPAHRATAASQSLFPLSVVNGSSTDVPLRSDAFDAALLLGVVSVVPDQERVLREARRVAQRVGVLDYCSTTAREVRAGGSVFAPRPVLEELVAHCGWWVEQASAMTVDSPRSWSAAAERFSPPPRPSEAEVAEVIARGEIAPVMLVAAR